MADLVSDGRKARVCAVDEDGRITHLHTVDTLLSYNGSIPSTRSTSHSRMAFQQRHRSQKEPWLLFSFFTLP